VAQILGRIAQNPHAIGIGAVPRVGTPDGKKLRDHMTVDHMTVDHMTVLANHSTWSSNSAIESAGIISAQA
jgi:hypothetical protein